MKCRYCGARIFVAGKNVHCTHCGTVIERDPRKKRNFFIGVGVLIALIIALIVMAFVLNELSRRNKALLPGIYSGMEKQAMLDALAESYPEFSDGVTRDAPEADSSGTGKCYVAYATYSKALGLNRPMVLEVFFVTRRGKPCVSSYRLSLPYTITTSETGSTKIVSHDVQTKIVPKLKEKYGDSEQTLLEYDKHYRRKEHVWAELKLMEDLTAFVDYGSAVFKEYGNFTSQNYCCSISYSGK